MRLKTKLWVAICGIVLTCTIFGIGFYFMTSTLSHDFPLDRNLIGNFEENRATFETLRRMATEDMHTESYFSESHLVAKLGKSRQNKYLELIAKIHHGLVITVDYDGTVRFIFSGGGLSAISSGWLKGIEYVPDVSKPNGSVVPSLDNVKTLSEGVYLKQIDSHWFIVYQRLND
jgi:hypothetical protein